MDREVVELIEAFFADLGEGMHTGSLQQYDIYFIVLVLVGFMQSLFLKLIWAQYPGHIVFQIDYVPCKIIGSLCACHGRFLLEQPKLSASPCLSGLELFHCC